ncbi:MAG: flavin reductase family protein [Thaumarchaeota archaeon]|nr:flavin reductase family protein [Nitrososphaerota archaeon]
MENKNAQLAQRFFMTGVSLVTSYGPHGKNVMAAEWTLQISYKPMLIAVFVHSGSNTLENIRKTRKFGINVASEEQSTLVSIAGGYSRTEIDKLKIRDSFLMLKSKSTPLPMVAGCVVNAECKLITIKKTGDHNMVIGRVTSIRHDETKKPLIYHRNRYFKIGKMIEPIRHKVAVNRKTFDLFCLPNQSKFILKCVGVLVRSKNKILVLDGKHGNSANMIPYAHTRKSADNKKELEKHLTNARLGIILKEEPKIKRLVIKNRGKIQRINFILFDGILKDKSMRYTWHSTKGNTLLQTLIK